MCVFGFQSRHEERALSAGARHAAPRANSRRVNSRNRIATNWMRMFLVEYCNEHDERDAKRHNDSEGKHGELPSRTFVHFGCWRDNSGGVSWRSALQETRIRRAGKS